jgi:uncharacterized membrane protein YtjA (UPF0391 family)
MFPITVSVLALLTVASALFAFGAIAIPAVSIARVLFMGFGFLLAVELTLGHKWIHRRR